MLGIANLVFALFPLLITTLWAMCKLTCCLGRKTARQDVFRAGAPPRFAVEIQRRARRGAWPFAASGPQQQQQPAQDEESSVGGEASWTDGYDKLASKPEKTTPIDESEPKTCWRDHHIRVKRLAKTNDGHVDLMRDDKSGELVAVKVVPVQSAGGDCWDVTAEIKALNELLRPHENIIKLRGWTYEGHPRLAYIRTEYCDGGDLHDMMLHWRKREYALPSLFILHVLTSISSALGYVHHGIRYADAEAMTGRTIEAGHSPVLHRDIKLANIFLRWSSASSRYGLPDIILGDFGNAVLEAENNGWSGTPGYYAPELRAISALDHTDNEAYRDRFRDQCNTKAADIYAFGVSLLKLLCLDLPEVFDPVDEDCADAAAALTSDPKGQMFMHSLLLQCLAFNAEDRCTAEELCKWSTWVKPRMGELYAQGLRMPDDSWPTPLAACSDSSRRQGNVSSPSGSRSIHGGARSAIDDMSQVSGFSDDFCWCLNHRALSHRRRGPDCAEELHEPLPSVGTEEMMGSRTD